MPGAAFTAGGLHLRQWRPSDLRELIGLYDTDEMNRWTPVPHPFTPDVALDYIRRAQDDLENLTGSVQLAICLTTDGPAVGEVLVFPAPENDTVELAYAVGAEHRGQHIASRAVAVALDLVVPAGTQRAVLTIAEDNLGSQATARAAGFAKTDSPLRRRERKGFVLMMQTWERRLAVDRR